MSDYQTIKNELDILKYVEFPEEAGRPAPSDDSSTMAALVRKAKAQQQTITQLQNNHHQAQAELSTALNQLQAATVQIKDLTSLNARLEADLLAAPQDPQVGFFRDQANSLSQQRPTCHRPVGFCRLSPAREIASGHGTWSSKKVCGPPKTKSASSKRPFLH